MASNWTERRLKVSIPAGATTYLDLQLLYAAANHRFISQNRNFVAKLECDNNAAFLTPASNDNAFRIQVLPTTWALCEAYYKAKEMYMKAMTPEMKLANKARWGEFRLYMDTQHKLDRAGGIYPVPVGTNPNFAGGSAEFEYSEVVDDTGANTWTWHVLGVTDNSGVDRSFGIMDEYDHLDDTSTDEASASASNYDQILNDVNSANELHLQDMGNKPPYNKDNIDDLPTKTWVIHQSGQTVGYRDDSTGFIEIPFGLVKVENLIAQPRELIVTFKRGKNSGIEAAVI